MRKIIDFCKWPLAFPLFSIAGIYIYWFFSAPMDIFGGHEDIRNYLTGLIIYSIFVLLNIVAYASRNNREVSFFSIILLLLFALLSLLFTIPSYSYLNNSGWFKNQFLFLILLAISVIYPAFKIIILDRHRFSWSSILVLIILTPIISANFGYTMIFSRKL